MATTMRNMEGSVRGNPVMFNLGTNTFHTGPFKIHYADVLMMTEQEKDGYRGTCMHCGRMLMMTEQEKDGYRGTCMHCGRMLMIWYRDRPVCDKCKEKKETKK